MPSTPAAPLSAFTRFHARCMFSLASACSSKACPAPSVACCVCRVSSLAALNEAAPRLAATRPADAGIRCNTPPIDMVFDAPSRSALRPVPATTTASADFSFRSSPSPFQAQDEISPGKDALLHRTTAGFTPPRLDHKSFAVSCPLALRQRLLPDSCSSARSFDSRLLSTVARPSAVALHFAHRGQLAAALSPTRVRPCWAHIKKAALQRLFQVLLAEMVRFELTIQV